MTQPDLFDMGGYQPKRARDSDPATSHAGAVHIAPKAGTMKHAVYLAIAAGGKTAEEAAHEAATARGGRVESYRKRTGELKADGLVYASGERRCRITGQMAELLEVVR